MEDRRVKARAKNLPSLPSRPRKHPNPPGRASFDEVYKELLDLNRDRAEYIRERTDDVITVEPGSSIVQGSWDLGSLGLEELPSKFGSLRVEGDLMLQHNSFIRGLPTGFGGLQVRGKLYLDNNDLHALPASFGSLCVGGDLTLYSNHISSLPPTFSALTVGGSVFLMDNPIANDAVDLNLIAAKAAGVRVVAEDVQNPD